MRKKLLRTPAVSTETDQAPGTAVPDGSADTGADASGTGDTGGAGSTETIGSTETTDIAGSGNSGSGDGSSQPCSSQPDGDSNGTPTDDRAAGSPAPTGRRARVRNRLLVSVVVSTLTVLGAGTPGVLAAARHVSESQHLVGLAHLDEKSLALSHDLADERDDMVGYVAAGRTSRDGAGLSESERARVDRQSADVAAEDGTPGPLRNRLYALPEIRQRALSGHGPPSDTYQPYTRTIAELHRVSAAVSRDVPGRLRSGTDDALPRLGTAVDQASAERGLLDAALASSGPQHELTGVAQVARQRERAALADFHDTADASADEVYDRTVTGAEVTAAERDSAKLTDEARMTAADRSLDGKSVDSELSARVDRMRSVQASLAAEQTERLEKLRDDDVSALEWDVALVLGLLLLAAGVAVQTARSMARPLSVLTRGSQRLAADPAGEGAVAYHGRNDEFAEVVRSLNRLRDTAVALKEHAGSDSRQAGGGGSEERGGQTAAGDDADADAGTGTGAETGDAGGSGTSAGAGPGTGPATGAGAHETLVAERDRLHAEYETLKEQLAVVSAHGGAESGAEEAAQHGAFVNHLALRTLGLVERQLGVIEGLENQETDPDRLGTLFKLDHLATRMRRHSENLLLLVGDEGAATRRTAPVPLVDVLRAAVSEIDRYERVELGKLPPHLAVAGPAADDISHLIAELLDNAAAFSPAETHVGLAGWVLENGDVMLSVRDSGVGMAPERLDALNARLRTPEPRPEPYDSGEKAAGGADGAEGPAGADGAEAEEVEVAAEREESAGLGLYVVARLAARHGLRVELRTQEEGGAAAVVTVPGALASSRPSPQTAPYAVYQRVPGPRGDPDGAAEAGPEAGREAEKADDSASGPDAPSAPASLAVTAENDPLIAAAERALREGAPDDPAGLAGTDSPLPDLIPDLTPDVPQPRASAESVPSEEEHARADETVDVGAHHVRDGADGTGGSDGTEGADRTDGDVSAESPADTGELTEHGLPKRTPRPWPQQAGGGAAPVGARGTSAASGVFGAAGEQRQRAASPEELRRQLGSFQRGALDGRRDAEAEVDAVEEGTAQPDAGDDTGPVTGPDTGTDTGPDTGVDDDPGAQSDGGTTEEART